MTAPERHAVYFVACFTTTFHSMEEVRAAAPEALARHLAQSKELQAKGMKSYRLVVVGRADPTGGENANQKLSDDRAAAVTQYLLKKAGVGPERILTPAAVGESDGG